MDICICAWTVFPGHLSATQIHSRVQVHNKQMSSTGLVYVCGFFSPFEVALFCLIKVKSVGKWSEKFIVGHFFCLGAMPFQGAGLEDLLTWRILFSVLSSQSVFLWAVIVRKQSFLSSIWLWTSNLFGKSYWCSLGGESSCWFSQLCFGNAWNLSQLESGFCCLFEFRVI